MKHDQRPDVAVYVVWSPQLGAAERHVPDATTLIPEPRVRHYWDPEALVGTLYMPVLGKLLGPAYRELADSGEAAWDVFLLFDGEARWDGVEPPAPIWWEHQLGLLPSDLRLDAERFAAKAVTLGNDGRRR